MRSQDKVPIALILSCAVLGGYAAMFTSFRDGFFDALGNCVYPSASAKTSKTCILDVPHASQMPKFTHTPFIDTQIALLVEFFAQALSNPSPSRRYDAETIVATICWTAQYGALWSLISLEGLRRENRRTVLSYTGIWGMMFQTCTVTIFSPIYFATHLLLSPTHPDQSQISVSLSDLQALPVSITASYLIPTIGLILSLCFGGPTALYSFIAIWQFFPVYQSALHPYIRSKLASRIQQKSKKMEDGNGAYRTELGTFYRFVLALSVGSHLLLIGAAFASSQIAQLPPISLTNILAPTSLTKPPTLALYGPPISAAASKKIVMAFLRWDIYCASTALSIWASVLAARDARGSIAAVTVADALFWAMVGGPVAPAAVMLRQRDMEVLRKGVAEQVVSEK